MIKLGDEVRDTVSGLKGIAVARHTYMQGCNRISVQQPVGEDGKLIEPAAFDEPQLEIIKAKKIVRKASEKDPGGPEKFSDTSRPLG